MSEQNKSLVLIVNETLELERMLVESGGEVNEDFERALQVNSKELSTKVDGYVEIIERFKAMKEHYKSRANFYAQIASNCENAADRLKDNIEYAMKELKVDEIQGTDMRFVLSNTVGSLNIIDEDLIPVEYKSEKTVTEIDKKALKATLSTGLQVPGAELIPGTSLKSFANTKAKKSKKEVV